MENNFIGRNQNLGEANGCKSRSRLKFSFSEVRSDLSAFFHSLFNHKCELLATHKVRY